MGGVARVYIYFGLHRRFRADNGSAKTIQGNYHYHTGDVAQAQRIHTYLSDGNNSTLRYVCRFYYSISIVLY